MSDPNKSAREEEVDSLEAYYNYVKDEDGYEGSVSEQWVESSAQWLNQQEINDWLAEGDEDGD